MHHIIDFDGTICDELCFVAMFIQPKVDEI